MTSIHIIETEESLIFETEKTDDAVNLAFKKTEADNRKLWLKKYDRESILDYTVKKTKIDVLSIGNFLLKKAQ